MPAIEAYQPAPGRYDEVGGASGKTQAHWRYLLQALGSLNRRQLGERQWEMRRLLIEHGISYNIYAESESRQRPWALDLLPFLITSREWRDIEVGLAQRAELLRQILQDIYGPQNLLRRGLLPAELVYGNPAFLMPCAGVELPPSASLILYGADIGRAPDGRFWVTQDRTQAPSGVGYALAARMIISRVLPSIFRESNVHPVLPFLRALRGALQRLAEHESERVALLSPGPANETYAEQAFLARQLGLPLVQGADLQVAGGRCYMLGTGERQRVSTLLRRMDDAYCDPLELNRQSILGSPGLLQAVRNRQLMFANSLGSGVLEHPLLPAVLPRLCHELLGEELKLPSVDTWWCARDADLWYVRNHFDEMVIRPLRGGPRAPSRVVARLEPDKRAELLARIEAEPRWYVAQAATAHASAPVLSGPELSSHAISLRTFAVAHGEEYRVMSGGIARAARAPGSRVFSGQHGGLSKDIWIIASEPKRDAITLPQYLPRRPRPRQLSQPHIAENLIWMGRYAARCETLSRILRLSHKRLDHRNGATPDAVDRLLLQALSWQTTLYPGFIGPQGEANLQQPEAELQRIGFGPEAGSLRHGVDALAEAAQPVRDLLVPEISELLNRLVEAFDAAEPPAQIVDQVYVLSAGLSGYLLRALGDDGALLLVELGYAIESAQSTARMLRSMLVGHALPVIEIEALLLQMGNALPAFETPGEEGDRYGLVYTLLLADTNPQSVRRALMVLERSLRSAASAGSASVQPLEGRIAAKLTELGTLDLQTIAADPSPDAALDQLLAQLDHWLRQTAEQIQARYTPRRAAAQTQLVNLN